MQILYSDNKLKSKFPIVFYVSFLHNFVLPSLIEVKIPIQIFKSFLWRKRKFLNVSSAIKKMLLLIKVYSK